MLLLSSATGFTGVVRSEWAATNMTSSACDVSSIYEEARFAPPNVISRGCLDVSCAGMVVDLDFVEIGRRFLYFEERDTENGEPKSICLSYSDCVQQLPMISNLK